MSLATLGGDLEKESVSTRTHSQAFSESTIRQVRLDSNRAMIRARFCPERSEIMQLRCIDHRPETHDHYGNQLWYFEGVGVDGTDRRHTIFGVVEYSTQYGLNELVEDGVFTTETQRERFRSLYEQEVLEPDWRQPAHRLLAVGVVAVSTIWLAYLLVRSLTA